ncbi:GH25 family lysozyme [Streptomyces sp. DW26H14]|uniref:GH25 family lysozyme n=1 Tax=Streptomyces sp. DW26H14 TaxID=3435395 RepID=UPI00403DF0AF
MTVKGVDVASYQSSTPSVSGLSFLFTKATQGTSYTNSKQTSQAATARKAGLTVGFYHFLTTGNIQAQAEYFVTKCASIEGDILACDWETDPSTGKHPTCAEKDAFIKAVKKLRPTHRVVLYCNTSFWKSIDTTSYCGDGLWIADPNHAAGKPGVTHAWAFHQYSISGGTDQNVANFATTAALKAWATDSTPPAPPKPPTPNPPEPVVTYTVESMAENYGSIVSIPVNSGDKATSHSGGYYLAHTLADVVTLKNMVATLSGKLDDQAKQISALTAAVAKLAPKS